MNTLTPIIVVRVDDLEITQEDIRAIKSVKLTMAEKKADTGSIIFRDPDIRIFDSRTYKKGADITLIMGWTHAMEIRGPYEVKKQKISFPESGEPELTVEFQDKSHSMNRRQRQRRFSGRTPSQIIQQIAEENELGYDIEDPNNVVFTDDFPLIQANQTDARLMQQLAERYGYVWGVEGGNLYFRRPVDLEALGQQSEVPVLSYRINDQSLKSFSPEMKFNRGRRRTGASTTSSNVDLANGTSQTNGIFQVLRSNRDNVASSLPQMAPVVRVLSGQDSDDDEPDTSSSSTTPTNERQRGRQTVDRVRSLLGEEIFRNTPDTENQVNENEESEPGDESGAATPQTEDEARRRAAGRTVRSSEIVEGTAIPSIASMRWRPQMAVILAGVGERLSGRYRVAQVDQTVSETFTTSLKVTRQTFRPSTTDVQEIADASNNEQQAGSETSSSTGQPSRTTQTEERYQIDRVRTRRGRRRVINGQETS